MQGTWVQSQDQEDPLEEDWQSTPVFLSGESDGQRSLAGYIVHVVARESGMTVYMSWLHWDDPEGWDGGEGGSGVQDGEHMHTHG